MATIGYTSVGTKNWVNQSYAFWISNYNNMTAGSNGTADSIFFAPDASYKFKVAIYEELATTSSRYSNSYEDTTVTGGSFNEVDISGESLSISSGEDYFAAWCGDEVGNFCGMQYDSGSSGDSEYSTASTYTSEMAASKISTSAGTGIVSIYIEYTESGGGTNLQLNISDAWKTVDALQINIGDVWKSVAGMQINIGDAWKTVY